MKFLFKTLPSLALACTLSLAAHAQMQQSVTLEEGHMPKKGKPMESKGPMRDCVMMKDGKMMTMKDGQAIPMASTTTMNNGTKVMTDGSVLMADGKKMMLHNGQMMLMDGTMMDHKTKKDKMKTSGSM